MSALPGPVRLRLRMSSHDAHYAGELVDGARMLGLFGDVATELLIALDGDEGLFRAYEQVEFLAPVYAGDYLEAFGEITHVGKTSRKMRFEVRKVGRNLRTAGAPASAAEMLSEPIVVCRAVGTCVTPVDCQRGAKASPVYGMPVILTAAIVGAEVTRAQNPHVPYTPEEIAIEAEKCRAAGAAIIHLHARTDEGAPSQSRDRFQATIEAIRKRTDVVVQVSTGGAVGMSIDERCGGVDVRPAPEMGSLNCGTINFGDEVFVNTRKEIRDIAARLKAAKMTPECELYEIGHLDEALALYSEGAISGAMHVQLVLGVRGALQPRASIVSYLKSELAASHVAHSWGVAALGRHQRPMSELAMRLGGHARVGLEDNIFLDKGVLAEGSAPLVARAAEYAASIGRPVAEPARARAMLGLGG
ncbi:MAG: 3-keto-5-aminohexanoate cleavage protein [Polyangiales bacterium]